MIGLILWLLLGMFFTVAVLLVSDDDRINGTIAIYCSFLGPLMGIVLWFHLLMILVDNYRDLKMGREV